MATDEWRDHAACKGQTELFFGPTRERPGHTDERVSAARGVCASCPVQMQCLDFALTTRQPHGVWAGLDEKTLAALHGEPNKRLRNNYYRKASAR